MKFKLVMIGNGEWEMKIIEQGNCVQSKRYENMKKVERTGDILYRIQEDWPIERVTFVDLTPTLTSGENFKKVATAMKDIILENSGDVDYIVSPDARGFLWGSYVAALLGKPLVPVRKHGKLPASCVMSSTKDTTEYSSIELDIPEVDLNGKRCVFIDDVYATGGTYKACQKLVEENNGVLDGAYVVLNVLLTKDNVNALMTSDELVIDGQKEEKSKVKKI